MTDDIPALGRIMKDDLVLKKELYREGMQPFITEVSVPQKLLKRLTMIPPVYGYNRTAIKERGELVAFIKEPRDKNTPLIAQCQYGNGKVAVFASSLSSSWGKDWLNWPLLPQVINQILRWLSPIDNNTNTIISLGEAGSISIAITTNPPSKSSPREYIPAEPAPRTEPSGQASYRYKLTDLSGINLTGEIPQVETYKYETVITGLEEGIYYATVYGKPATALPNSGKNQSASVPVTLPIIISYFPEWIKFGPDRIFLKNIAEITGGQMLERLDDYQRTNASLWRGYRSMSMLLILLSLGLFILDLLIKVIFHRTIKVS